jgi:hypothetical protein
MLRPTRLFCALPLVGRARPVFRLAQPCRGRSDYASPYSAQAEYAAAVLSGRSSLISSFNTGTDALELAWADGHSSRFHYVWLRDHCPSSFDVETRQRAVNHLHIPRGIVPARVTASGGVVQVRHRREWQTSAM